MKSFFSIVIVFVVVFFLVFVILTGRFGLFVDSVLPREKSDNELMQVLTDRHFGISPFWLERYQVSINDISDIHIDADVDGLSLIDEYANNTHPLIADTDGDGYNDGLEVKNGYSPTGKGRLDANNNNLSDLWEEEYRLPQDVTENGDLDNDNLSNKDEFLYGTHPLVADTDGDGYNDGKEVRDGYDPAAAGETKLTYKIMIDKIGVDAPVILSDTTEENQIQKDLERGVILYPGRDMVVPGAVGNAYIAGHSSNYSWSKGNFNTIFKDLIDVNPGDQIIVAAITNKGKEVRYTYTVSVQREVEADEPEIFELSNDKVLTLTTCWPLGTTLRRIMVKATLIDTDEELVFDESLLAEEGDAAIEKISYSK